MSDPSAFKTPEGEAAFLAAYDAAMKLWPVPYEEMDVPTPSKSVPAEPIRDATDYAAWLTATLDALHLDSVCLMGMSFGGWLALNFAVAAPARLRQLVLLSPGGFLPMVRQFSLRGILMVAVPTRFTVNSFMKWLGFTATNAGLVLELMYLGLKHFRVPPATARVMPTVFSDDVLRVMRVPTLLLIGDHEVISAPATAVARAHRLIPHVEGELVPHCRHDMCFSQYRIVDARVLDFLKMKRTDDRGAITERSVA